MSTIVIEKIGPIEGRGNLRAYADLKNRPDALLFLPDNPAAGAESMGSHAAGGMDRGRPQNTVHGIDRVPGTIEGVNKSRGTPGMGETMRTAEIEAPMSGNQTGTLEPQPSQSSQTDSTNHAAPSPEWQSPYPHKCEWCFKASTCTEPARLEFGILTRHQFRSFLKKGTV